MGQVTQGARHHAAWKPEMIWAGVPRLHEVVARLELPCNLFLTTFKWAILERCLLRPDAMAYPRYVRLPSAIVLEMRPKNQ
jgi:hypothetical protein